MRRLIPALLLVSVLAPGCASPKADFATICEITNKTRAEKLEPTEEAQVLARRINKGIKTAAAREAMKAVGTAAAGERYSLLQAAARKAGATDWSCPALEEMLRPAAPAPGR